MNYMEIIGNVDATPEEPWEHRRGRGRVWVAAMTPRRQAIARAAAALEAVNARVTPFSLGRATELGHQTVRRELHAMADEGLAERHGDGRAAVWVVRPWTPAAEEETPPNAQGRD